MVEIVDIERRFSPIGRGQTENQADRALFARFWADEDGVLFDELLQTPCSVLLGTQGSGKTTEFRRAMARQRAAGKACFHVRLETLGTLGLRASLDPLDPEAQSRFDAWVRSTKPAIFLLDALDEATLPEGGSTGLLTGAMDAFANGVGPAGPKCSIILSSRGSEWNDATDRDTLLALTGNVLGQAYRARPEAEKLKVYALAALSRAQVAAFANTSGVPGDAFVQAIADHHCEALARTPLEVGYLCDVWKEDVTAGRPPGDSFSTRAALFERAVEYKLRPPEEGPRRSDLPRDDVIEAVEALAAATIISGANDISLTVRNDKTLDPGQALMGSARAWTEPELRQLLSFSFFAANIAGRVRFAHRELRDYLAARYFDRIIIQSGGALDCLTPLIARFGDHETVPGALFNFFGWLATFNAAARRRVIELYPTLLMETGDPSRISADDRAAALRAHAAAYNDRVSRGHYFYAADLVAFSSADLADTVAELLEAATSPELKEHLLEIVRCGALRPLADITCAIACDPQEARRVRTEAMSALIVIGARAHQVRVRQAVLEAIAASGEVSPDAAARWNEFLLVAARLVVSGMDDLAPARPFLDALARERKNGGSLAGRTARDMVEADDPMRPAAWLELLLPIALGERSEDHHRLPQFRAEKLCLMPAIAAILKAQVESHGAVGLSDAACKAMEALSGARHDQAPYRYERDVSDFLKTLAHHPEVKAALLEHRWQSFDGDPEKQAWRVVHSVEADRMRSDPPLWHGDDVLEQLRRAERSSSDGVKERRFHTARQISTQIHRDRGWQDGRRALIQFARKSGRKDFKQRVVPRWPNWFWSWWVQNSYKFELDHIKNFVPGQIKRFFRRLWVQESDRRYRWRRAGATARGEAHNILAWASQQYPSDQQDKGVDNNLIALEQLYGRRFARRVKAGYRKLWPRIVPGLPTAWSNRLIEAAGLGIELDIANNTAPKSDQSAAQAATIAFSAWGSAPDWTQVWLPDYGAVFKEIARPAIKRDLRRPHSRSVSGLEAVQSIAYGPPILAETMAETLVDELLIYPDAPHETLRIILSLALRYGASAPITETVLQSNIGRLAGEGRFAEAFLWLELWMRRDPVAAWAWTMPWFGLWTFSPASPFLQFLSSYGALGQRHTDDPEPIDQFAQHPHLLGALIKTAYLIADPYTDNVYEDGYSPNRRDRAQEIRRGWTSRLQAMTSRAAHDALLALSDDPDLMRHRDTFLYHADRLANGAARHNPIPAGNVGAWLRDHVPVPTDRAGYVAYVFRLTEQLLHRFAHSDHDEARPYRRLNRKDISARDEADARNWLSGRLAETGRNVFEPVREAETVAGNRTDIHLVARNPQLGTVVLEVKLADRSHWSGDVLVSTLETQVRDQYLRDEASHAGALVLINTRRDGFAKRVSGRRVDFPQLCAAIDARIDQLDDGKTYRLLSASL